MRRLSHFFLLLALFSFGSAIAQSGCPGCSLALPTGLPADTIFSTPLPHATKGKTYAADLSFRLPKTTTPVAAYDSTTPPNLPINKFVITGIDSLPAGIKWQANQTTFNPNNLTDGCLRFCGTPTVADTFNLLVRLDVTVLIVTREAFFRVQLIVDPASVSNDGFSMTNVEGCGSVDVSFQNNVPSNGQTGFTYSWNFGDSTKSTLENPPMHTYNQPGSYVVDYKAVVDTAGYTLSSVELLDAACGDAFGLGAPDVFFVIKNADGNEIYNSGPDVMNISFPYTFSVGLDLGMGNYTIEFWDEDSGLEGSDDLCGILSFNILSNDTLSSGDLTADLNIDHPIEEVVSTDTVTVFFQPTNPSITPQGPTFLCAPASVVLFSSTGTGNTWWKNGVQLVGETDFNYEATQSGSYQIIVATQQGCTAASQVLDVTINPTPPNLAFTNTNNFLSVPDSSQAANVEVEWTLNGTTLQTETWSLCAQTSGSYTIFLTNPVSGCSSSYSAMVQVNPNYDCTVSENTPIAIKDVVVYPNPTLDFYNIRLSPQVAEDGRFQLIDMWGRVVSEKMTQASVQDYVLPVGGAPSGIYALRLQLESGARMTRLVEVVRD